MKEMRSAAAPELYYFLQEFIEAQEGETIVIKASDFYSAYREWHSLQGTEKVKTMTAFGKEVKQISGITKILDREGTVYEIEKNCLEFLKSIV
jgi:phage/plasmid-associated DNA primase